MYYGKNNFQNAGQQTALFSSTYGDGDGFYVTDENLWQATVMFIVQLIFSHTWLNYNDQFLQPDKPLGEEFINACLVWMLFSGKNLTASADGLGWQDVEHRQSFHSIH